MESRTRGKSNFMKGLKEPTFKNVESFREQVDRLPEVDFAKASVNGFEIDGRYIVVEKESGRPIAQDLVSTKYKIAQDKAVFGPLVKAFEQNATPIYGSIERVGGVTRASIAIDHPIRLSDSDYHPTFMVENSFDGSLAVRAISAILRAICGNGMFSIAGCTFSNYAKHNLEESVQIQIWENFFQNAEEGLINLAPIINQAQEETLAWNRLDAMLRGAGIGLRDTAKIYEAISEPTRWNAYNAITAHFSHREKGGHETNLEGLRAGARFLQEPVADLFFRGQEIITAEGQP